MAAIQLVAHVLSRADIVDERKTKLYAQPVTQASAQFTG